MIRKDAILPANEVWLAALVVAGALVHFFGTNVADPDLWGHLRYGSEVLAGGGIPWVDHYSYTAAGAPFFDHEWLSDVLVAGVWHTFGSAGLIVAKLVCGLAIIVLLRDAGANLGRLLHRRYRAHPVVEALVLVLALSVMAPGATFRPQLFTMFFLALQLAILARADLRWDRPGAARTRIGWEVLSQPVLLAIWANCHGGFLVGVGAFGCFVGCHLAQMLMGSRRVSSRDGLVLAGTGLVALLAPIANPYGVGLYGYLWRTLGDHGMISEWHPVALLDANFARFHLLVLLAAAALLFLYRRRVLTGLGMLMTWWAPLLVLAALYGYRHQRHTVLFAELAVPILLVVSERIWLFASRRWTRPRPTRSLMRGLALGLLAIVVLQVGSYARVLVRDGATIRFDRFDYPVDAVQFLHEHGFRGNVAMPFEWGAYANWKLGSDFRVFIDGRFEAVFPRVVIDDYFRFTEGVEGWQRLLDAYPTDIVVVQRWRNIHPRLFARGDLRYVYSDPAALVFVRDNETNREALGRVTQLADARLEFQRLETVFP